MVVLNAHQDVGFGLRPADANVMKAARDAQRDAAGVELVLAQTVVGVGAAVGAGGGFGACGVGGRGVARGQRSVRTVVTVGRDEDVDGRLRVKAAEDGAGWLAFFRDLTARNLTRVEMVTSDAHRGFVDANRRYPPGGGLVTLQNPLRGEPDGHCLSLLGRGCGRCCTRSMAVAEKIEVFTSGRVN